MGLSLFGSVVWLTALVGSLVWPAVLAWLFARWQHRLIPDRNRFLLAAIPVSYVAILGSHQFLGEFVQTGAVLAAESGDVLQAWSRVIATLVVENVLALLALAGLLWLIRTRG